jgi:bla regulator protein BlaR1
MSERKSQRDFEKNTPTPQKSTAWLDICAYLWISGIIILLAAACISYWRMYSHTKKVPDPDRRYIEDLLQNNKIDLEIDKKIRIRYSNCFISPFTIGIFKPCIVIPDTLIGLLDKQKLDIILRHELIHIKRNDHITRVLSYILQAIHWFNPLIWVSFKLMA